MPNKTNIDWPDLDYTLNPVVGCLNNCEYCYARTLHNSRHKAFLDGKLQNLKQYALDFNNIQYFENRLEEPYKIHNPSTFFIGSMSGIRYWKPEFIEKIMVMCADNKHHTFMFLTHHPKSFENYCFPLNCKLGFTLDTYLNKENQLRQLERFVISTHRFNAGNTIFLSLEPLLGELKVKIGGLCDMVIIGALTKGSKSIYPTQTQIQSIIKNINNKIQVHWKRNILKAYLVGGIIVFSPDINLAKSKMLKLSSNGVYKDIKAYRIDFADKFKNSINSFGFIEPVKNLGIYQKVIKKLMKHKNF